jgi:hypothetical protein
MGGGGILSMAKANLTLYLTQVPVEYISREKICQNTDMTKIREN